MKRTKEWWACLTVEERSRLVYLERSDSYSSGYSAGGMIPDDCCECGSCSTPHLGSGLCLHCLQELIKIIKKADDKMQEKKRKNDVNMERRQKSGQRRKSNP